MLTRPTPPPCARRRPAATFAALGPTASVAHPGLVAVTVTLAAVPALLSVALSSSDLFPPTVLAGVVAGAAVGWAVDDPAAELLASMPIGAPARLVARIGVAALMAGAGLGALLLVLAVGPGLPADIGDRGPEAAAAGSVGLAVGLLGARRGERAAGAGAVTAGVLGTALVAGLSARFPDLPSFLPGPRHGRWWLLAVAALVVAVHAGRDPARR